MNKAIGYVATTLVSIFLGVACSSSSSSGAASGGDAGSPASDAATGKAIGSDCTQNSDCASNLCNDDPQCTKLCSVPADCPAGSVCESDRPGGCYKECTSNADCAGNTAASQCIGGPNPEGKMWCDVAPSGDGG